jgi:hypothetical protein
MISNSPVKSNKGYVSMNTNENDLQKEYIDEQNIHPNSINRNKKVMTFDNNVYIFFGVFFFQSS